MVNRRLKGGKSSSGIIFTYCILKNRVQDMLDKIVGIEERYEEINQLLMETGDDYQRASRAEQRARRSRADCPKSC
jgi:hypothetical protein